MTQELLKLALEALEDLLDQAEAPPDKNCSCHIAPPCSDCIDYSGVRYAIKQANKTITAIKEALAQPEQEPVAYIHRNEFNEYRLEPTDNFKITDLPVGVEMMLYTAPPQRPRVVFPTMLRKMWSGGEVQAWLDENVNKENT